MRRTCVGARVVGGVLHGRSRRSTAACDRLFDHGLEVPELFFGDVAARMASGGGGLGLVTGWFGVADTGLDRKPRPGAGDLQDLAAADVPCEIRLPVAWRRPRAGRRARRTVA